MALQTTGAISLSQIQTEFGGANPVSMSEYYRGGTYVESGATSTTSIPTSGSISMNDFYGGTNPTGTTFTMSEGSWGSSNVGYYTGIAGSLTPTTFNGITIRAMYFVLQSTPTEPNNDLFYFLMAGNRDNTAWNTIQFSNTTFSSTTGVRTYNSGSNYTQWFYQYRSAPGDMNGTGTQIIDMT